MVTRLVPVLVACLLACSSCSRRDAAMSPEQENQILALVLAQPLPDGGYTVVRPRTTLSPLDLKELKGSRDAVRQGIKIEGYDVGKLFDLLMARNREPFQLTLESSPKDGYVIDYDGKYSNYFANGGGGWEKWRQENPQAHGMTSISRPAYDPEAGVVLIYMGTQADWLAGTGGIVAFRYRDGALTRIGQVMLWIS